MLVAGTVAPPLIRADQHGRAATLKGEANGDDEVAFPRRPSPWRIRMRVGTGASVVSRCDLVDEIPRFLAEGAVGFADEAAVVHY